MAEPRETIWIDAEYTVYGVPPAYKVTVEFIRKDIADTAVREAVAETWKAAIETARAVSGTIAPGEENNEFHGLIVQVIEALESAATKGEKS